MDDIVVDQIDDDELRTSSSNILVTDEPITKTFVQEAAELKSLVKKLVSLDHTNQIDTRTSSNRITNILALYAEQSNLLDIHLNDIIVPLIQFIKSDSIKNYNEDDIENEKENTNDNNDETYIESVKETFRILYVLAKIRGYKTIIKLFPHEVVDLLPVLKRLEIVYEKWSIEFNNSNNNKQELQQEIINNNNNFIEQQQQLQQQDDDNNFNDYTNSSYDINSINNDRDISNSRNNSIYAKEDIVTYGGISWHEIYILSLWVSLLIKIPFKFTSIDPRIGEKSISGRIIAIGKLGISDSSKIRDSFAEMLSGLLTRPDMKLELHQFITWTTQEIKSSLVDDGSSNEKGSSNNLIGIFLTLASIFKKGNRIDFLPFDNELYQQLVSTTSFAYNQDSMDTSSTTSPAMMMVSSSTIAKKLLIKLAQRIAIIMLPPITASWRYQKLIKPLLLKETSSKQINFKENDSKEEQDEDEEIEIPEEIEEIIEILLNGLKDKDSIVRWTSAKGIGRMVNLLPREFGDQVIGSVIDMFEKDETIDADPSPWHGACLSLAELSRRGLLLPDRLDEVVPLIMRALHFDVLKGTFSIGTFVRDSACYVIWALARSYHHSVLEKYIVDIGKNLVVVSLFDKEINVRKSASAAYQEMVGRHQGMIPHGIDIVTTADFFAVGNRKNSYTQLVESIGQYPEYYIPMVQHIATVKIYHWDLAIRELACQSLKIMTDINPNYIVSNILPQIIPHSKSDNIPTRHGSTLALILLIIKNTKGERLYKGKGGILIRMVICKLIYSICLLQFRLDGEAVEDPTMSKSTISSTVGGGASSARSIALREKVNALKAKSLNKTLSAASRVSRPSSSSSINNTSNTTSNNSMISFEIILSYLEENLSHPNEDVQKESAKAITLLFKNFMVSNKEYRVRLYQLSRNYCKSIKTENSPVIRRGSSLALGAFPFLTLGLELDLTALDEIVRALIESMFVELPSLKDIETRVNSCHSMGVLGYFAIQMLKTNKSPNHQKYYTDLFKSIWNCLMKATDDYTVDKRGDVGSWVRELSCKILFNLIEHLDCSIESRNILIENDMVKEFICKLFKLASEKLDKIRNVTCTIIHKLIWIEPFLDSIPHRNQLELIFEKNPSSIINWARSDISFPLLCLALEFPIYQYPLLTGLLSSIGGGTSKYLIDSSIKSITEFLNKFNQEERNEKIKEIGYTVIKIIENTPNDSKMVLPTFKSIVKILETHYFDQLLKSTQFSFSILKQFEEKIKLNDIYLLLSLIPTLTYILNQFSTSEDDKNIRNFAIKNILSLISNESYPRVRKVASDSLLSSKFIQSPENQKIYHLLIKTQWDNTNENNIKELDELYSKLNQPKPMVLQTLSSQHSNNNIIESDVNQIKDADKSITTPQVQDDYIPPEDSNDLMEI
eukprot:gene4883-6091_t